MKPRNRFGFGKNWQHFLRVVNADRIAAAEKSLQKLLSRQDLNGRRFLDIGCGSGLFSLAARRLGADVYSFDYDVDAVACTQEMKRRHAPDQDRWVITQGSVLDKDFLKSLGQFDIVYSWGVLHHTGSMWEALDNVHALVAPGGLLALAIYNDQGGTSRRWAWIKTFYNVSPRMVRFFLIAGVGLFFEIRAILVRLTKLQNPLPFKGWAESKHLRGMSAWYDLVDWVGGYPFEVAKPEAIFDFFSRRSFTLVALKTCGGGLGCNEFAFKKERS